MMCPKCHAELGQVTAAGRQFQFAEITGRLACFRRLAEEPRLAGVGQRRRRHHVIEEGFQPERRDLRREAESDEFGRFADLADVQFRGGLSRQDAEGQQAGEEPGAHVAQSGASG